MPDPVFLELDGQPFELDLAQDINKIARETLNDARLRMTIKNIARLYAKVRAAEEVRRQGGELAGLLATYMHSRLRQQIQGLVAFTR